MLAHIPWQLALLWASAMFVGGCAPSKFACSSAAECTNAGIEGSCEPSGWCSFPDPNCPSGSRYGENTGDGLAQTCTVPSTDMTSGGPTTDATATTGSSTDASTSSTSIGSSGGSSPNTTATTTRGESASSGGESSGTGNPELCPDAADACDAWFLSNDATQWEPVTIGGRPELRPKNPVLVAFDIEAEQRGFVITSSEVCTFDLQERAWLDKRPLADLFPDAIGEDLLIATSTPAVSPPVGSEEIRLITSETAYIYDHDAETDTFVLQSITEFGLNPDPNAAPASSLQARWFSAENAAGWAMGNPADLCQAGTNAVTSYAASIADGALYIRDLNECFLFFAPGPYEMTVPTSYAEAPAAADVVAAVHNEVTGLVLFTGRSR